MFRLLLLLVCIVSVGAYPKWFFDYMKTHNKKYTQLERRLAFQVLKPKYEHIQQHTGGLKLQLFEYSDKRFKKGRKLMRHKRQEAGKCKKTPNARNAFDI